MDTISEVAIVGMSCRFPGANDADTFWKNIVERRESLSSFSAAELKARGVGDSILNSSHYVRSGFVVDDVDQFDAGFFGFTPREAEILDPQQRLFLECAWHALEHGGHAPERYAGRIGVYAGVFSSAYLLNIYSQPGLVDAVGELAVRHANEKDYLATRLSYKLNLTGPSVAVQTSCSTALVAVHMAVQSLLAGECDMALSGGASITHPSVGYAYEPGGLASPDGHCRPFDADARGTVFGNGVGVVLLKRVADAIKDGNTIYAIIKGSAVNNDGSDKVGFTAPSVNGQTLVIGEALGMAGVLPDTIGMVEAHGTGTPLGDPIEIEALTRAWRAHTEARGYCAIGSVKSNIGHLGAAAGIAGLMKAALALHHETLPPTINYAAPNPNIDFANSPFFVNAAAKPWPGSDAHPRRAAVSSFGMGGTNAHVVLEEAPAVPVARVTDRQQALLCLSARSEAGLLQAASNLGEHLRANPSLSLHDAAHTLRDGRRLFAWRAAVGASSIAQAVEALTSGNAQKLSVNQSVAAPEVAFLFPGQGSQYAGACRGLYDAYPEFAQQFDACAAILRNVEGPNLNELMAGGASAPSLAPRLNDTAIAQSVLFVIEYALAKLLESMGVEPRAMLGHSVGEYVAATLAGVFSLEDALRLVALRGRLMQGAAPGKMLSVAVSEAKLRSFLAAHEDVDLAAINGPEQCVVAGPAAHVSRLNADLMRAGVVTRSLLTSHAFHSSMMDPILDEFGRAIRGVTLRPPKLPYLSNVTGDWIRAEEAVDPQYWTEHVRKPVKFDESARRLLENPHRVLVEVGPNTVLTALMRLQPSLPNPRRVVPLSRHAKDSATDLAVFGNALAQLWTNGVELAPDERARRRIPLPAYPFERQRYWIDRHDGHGQLGKGKPIDGHVDQSSSQPASASVRPQPAAAPAGVGLRFRWRPAALAGVPAHVGGAHWLLLGNVQQRVARAFAETLTARGLAWSSVKALLPEHDVARATHVVYFADETSRKCPAEQYAAQLTAHATPGTRTIAVVTQRAQNVDSAFELAAGVLPILATVADFMPRYPQCSWVSLDVALAELDSATANRFAADWIDDIQSARAASFVAWRGRQRYVLGAEPAAPGISPVPDPLALRPGSQVAIVSASPSSALALARALHARQIERFLFVLGGGIASWDDLLGAEGLVDDGAIEALGLLLEKDADLAIHTVASDAVGADDLLRALRSSSAVSDVDAVVCLFEGAGEHAVPNGDTFRVFTRAQALEAAALADVTVIASSRAPDPDACLTALGTGHSHVLLNALTAAAPAHAVAPGSPAARVDVDSSTVEAEIIAIWKSLFGVPSIGADDDFFAVGGNSLVAIQLISRVRERFGVELSIETLFEDPTVRGVSTQVQALLSGSIQSSAGRDDAELKELLSLSDEVMLEDLRASAE